MKLPALLLMLLVAGVQAGERLSDAPSPRQQIQTRLEWAAPQRLFELDEDGLNRLAAHAPAVEVRLDTTAYEGQRVTVYLGLPPDIQGLRSPAGLRLGWQTRGVFSPGTLVPGGRALLFRGTIDGPVLSDVLDFSLEIDARELSDNLVFEPYYELEEF